MLQSLAERMQRKQQTFQQMAQGAMNSYMQMFNTPLSYAQKGAQIAQEDIPESTERSTVRDPKEDQYRRSAGQSS